MALITSARPLRCGIEDPLNRLFCGPSSTRVAMPLWMYSTCTRRSAPIAPSLHELPRVPDHRIRGVAVRDGENPACSLRARDEIARLCEVVRHGLVANDVETRIERGRRDA